ncbi:MAG TPA: DUF4097 family beta strand repeat-containing protein [Gemmatimonadales bacterium]|nr:DUF4097 family beta strand repeat-containing protein [Gemmatimonadales bacterium]
MSQHLIRPMSLAAAGLAVLALPALAQQPTIIPNDSACASRSHNEMREYCEVRQYTLPAVSGTLGIDAAPNGGIRVIAWNRNATQVRAIVRTRERTDAAARAMAGDVHVRIDGSRFRTDGPNAHGNRGWSVSFEVYTPRRTDLDLHSTNGGIRVQGIDGDIAFRTTNGGVHLTDLAGDVRGRTVNGGVSVALTGTAWSGDGLDVTTTNGGVRLTVPANYSAHLETGTVNGGLDLRFPVTVQGRLHRGLTADLGNGGKTIRVKTTNGSVTLARRE